YRQGSNIYSVTLGGAAPAGEGRGAAPAAAAAGGRGGRGGDSAGARRLDFTARVEVNHRAERRQVFLESWRVMKHRFYDPAMHGQPLKAGDNYWKHYAEAVGTRLELTVNSKPQTDGAWTTRVAPVSGMQYGTLQYEKWVADRRAMVDKLSGGTIGYLHIRQMN